MVEPRRLGMDSNIVQLDVLENKEGSNTDRRPTGCGLAHVVNRVYEPGRAADRWINHEASMDHA